MYIGDRTIDYDEASKAGVKSIIVEYGWGYDHEKVPKPKVIVNNPKDILTALNEINSEKV